MGCCLGAKNNIKINKEIFIDIEEKNDVNNTKKKIALKKHKSSSKTCITNHIENSHLCTRISKTDY